MEKYLKTFLSLFMLTVLANSQIINGIAFKVNDIPVTLYEIENNLKNFQNNKKTTIQYLINIALEKAEILKLNLQVSDIDIDRFITNIMKQNMISSKSKFFQTLNNQGISKTDFVKNVEKQILKQKLYQKITSNKIIQPLDSRLLKIYKEDILKYTISDSYKVTIYSSENISALKDKISNPMMFLRNVKMEESTISSEKVSPQLLNILASTKLRSFSKITTFQNRYVTFYILDKNGTNRIPFESVKAQIKNNLLNSQQSSIIKNYFANKRNTSTIEYLR